MKINDQIDEIINLIHSLNPDKEVYKKMMVNLENLKMKLQKLF